MASAELLADRAETIGAEWVLTVFTEKVPLARIEHCAKMFDGAGAGIAVEYTPLGAGLNGQELGFSDSKTGN